MKICNIAPIPLAILLAAPFHAQVGASRIEGAIVDPSGAAVPRATVTSRSERTGRQATTSSDSGGWFVLPSLEPGFYQLTAEAAGFRPEVVTGIDVRIAEVATVRVALLLGAIGESVTVEAEQSAVHLADAHGGGIIS